jgi:NADH:ubiquinone oxidoreductase subunit 2 (subunit N)
VAFFYYLAVIGRMWLSPPPEEAVAAGLPSPSPFLGLSIALSVAGVIVLGILPGLLVQYTPLSTLVASR